jgi:HEPN domain-containing protein
MNSLLEHAQGLLARARDDLYVVRRLRTDPAAPGWVMGFHAQQAVEKALKAVLSSAGQAYPRTHNLVMLAELLRGVAIAPPPDVECLSGVLLRRCGLRLSSGHDQGAGATEWRQGVGDDQLWLGATGVLSELGGV